MDESGVTFEQPKHVAPENISPEEKAHFEQYGRLPKPARIQKHKQNFDSADWSMKKSVQSGENQEPAGSVQPVVKQNPRLGAVGGTGTQQKKPMVVISKNPNAGTTNK